ncbi:MAG: type II toxin-antitoxin system VapC family toxin [Actinomycetota bacterium]|nr:type II toxin-antitoxin system VapC family toxin [Actinomycetota bacterium]
MSQTVDTNVLLYAADSSSPRHEPAADLLAELAGGPSLLHLFWPTLLGFVRIATHPAVFRRPLTHEEATEAVERLLARPNVQVAGEGERFWLSYRRAAEPVGPRGNLVPDAHLVALMHEHGVTTIWTHDRDFRKFDGITARDPFAR